MRTIGIVGVGVVGGAMLQAFRERGVSVIAYDKFLPGFDDDVIHFEALIDAEMVFVSVPTLTKKDGIQDLLPLEEVLTRLSHIHYKGIVVSKCTTLPGTMRSLQAKFHNLRIVHNPEFLTAAKAYEDFKYQKIVLLSGQIENTLLVAEFYRDLFPNLPVKIHFKYASTEIAKYTHNCFLATKVSFLNEIYDICQIYGISYTEMITSVIGLEKIGETHTKVPGNDGQRGFGGFCLPKDTKAFLHYMEGQGLELNTLKGAIQTNKRLRDP